MTGSGHKFLSKTSDKEEEQNHLKTVREHFNQPFPLDPHPDSAKLLHDIFEIFVPNSLNR